MQRTDVDRFLYCLEAELQFAMTKFPSPNLTLPALIEEVGELAQALLKHKYEKGGVVEVYAEAVQVAAMAIRIALEGSSEFPYKYEYKCYEKFDVNKQVKKG